MVRRDALAVKRIDAADLAEVVPRRPGVKAVLAELLSTGQQTELSLGDFDHERVLAFADGTVAHRQLREVRLDLEAHGAAMARTTVLLHGARTHGRLLRQGGQNLHPATSAATARHAWLPVRAERHRRHAGPSLRERQARFQCVAGAPTKATRR